MSTKTALVLLLLLTVGTVSATDHTYVSNRSSRNLRASTTYAFSGHSDFTNRLILSGHWDQDQYNWIACPIEEPGVHVFVWIDGASNTTSEVFMFCDVSVVCFDNIDGTGVDVFQSVYGYIDEKEGPVLMTIFP